MKNLIKKIVLGTALGLGLAGCAGNYSSPLKIRDINKQEDRMPSVVVEGVLNGESWREILGVLGAKREEISRY